MNLQDWRVMRRHLAAVEAAADGMAAFEDSATTEQLLVAYQDALNAALALLHLPRVTRPIEVTA